jgi:hypothetical protein
MSDSLEGGTGRADRGHPFADPALAEAVRAVRPENEPDRDQTDKVTVEVAAPHGARRSSSEQEELSRAGGRIGPGRRPCAACGRAAECLHPSRPARRCGRRRRLRSCRAPRLATGPRPPTLPAAARTHYLRMCCRRPPPARRRGAPPAVVPGVEAAGGHPARAACGGAPPYRRAHGAACCIPRRT